MMSEKESREIALDDLEEAVEDEAITRRQADAVRRMHREVLMGDGLGEAHVAEYEYKEFKVELVRFVYPEAKSESLRVGKWSLWISTVVGRKGDENTAASVFARTRRFISVSPRGSATNHFAKAKKRSTGYWAARGSSRG